MQFKESKKVYVKLLPGNILECRWKDDVDIDPEDILKLEEIAWSLTKGEPFKSIAIFKSGSQFLTGTHIEASNSAINSNMLAEAIVAPDLAQKIILNWYSKQMAQIQIPTKVFASEKEAKVWLNSIPFSKVKKEA